MENIPNQETGLAPAVAGRQRVLCTGSRRGREQEGTGSGPGFPTAPASLRPRRSTASPAAALSPAAAELMARERSSTGTVRAAGACPHIHARSRACTCSAPTYRGYPAPWALLRLQGAAGPPPPLLVLSGAGRKPCSREVLPYFTLRLQCFCWKRKTQFPLLSNVLNELERSTLQLLNLS